MKAYKFLRGLLKGSAIMSVMFVMQACYGSPYSPDNYPNPEVNEFAENDTLTSAVPSDLQSGGIESEDLQSVE